MVYVWNRATGALYRRFREPLGTPLLVKFSPRAKRVACASRDRTVRIWNLRTRRSLNVLQVPAVVHAMIFMDAGRRLLTGDCSGRIRIWRLKTGRQSRIFSKKSRCVRSILFGQGGRVLYSGGDALRRWRMPGGRFQRKILAVPGRIHLLVLLNNHRMLMQDGYRTARIVNLRTGVTAVMRHYGASVIASRAASSARDRLFLCFSGAVHVASMRTLRLLGRPFSAPNAYLNAVAVSHGGQLLAAGPFERSRRDRSFVAVWKLRPKGAPRGTPGPAP